MEIQMKLKLINTKYSKIIYLHPLKLIQYFKFNHNLIFQNHNHHNQRKNKSKKKEVHMMIMSQ